MFLIERLEAFCFTINRTVNINNINILQTRLTKSTSITLYILICQDSRGNTNYSRNTINVVAFLCKKKPFGATINTSTFSLLQGRNIHQNNYFFIVSVIVTITIITSIVNESIVTTTTTTTPSALSTTTTFNRAATAVPAAVACDDAHTDDDDVQAANAHSYRGSKLKHLI